jgi:Na+-transporting methylmalonyl-CoA/oxaloacetate decarboxylase gamma subunit
MRKENKNNLFIRNFKIGVAILLVLLVLLILYWSLSGEEISYIPIDEPKKCIIPVPVPEVVPETVPSPEQVDEDDSEFIENVIVVVIIYTATLLFLIFVPDWTIYDDK